MNRHEFEIYLELYKKKEYAHIPIGAYANGDYFYCTDKQIRTLQLLSDDTTTSVGYGGSARSGKTVIEATAIIFDCFCYDDIAWGLARKELTTLKRTALLTLFKQLSFYGIKESIDYNYNQQLNKITFNNKSDIFLIDTAYKPSDPLNTRFGGFELTKCAVDESNETQQDVIDKLFERTGWRNNEKHGLKRKLFECFNPAKNHVYSRFYKPFVNLCETAYRKFVLALPKDNPNPAVAEWIRDMLADDKISESTKQRQIYGNFEYDDNPNILHEYDDILNLFTNRYVQKTGIRGLSADIAYNGSDLFVINIWDGLVIEKVIVIEKIDDTLIGTKIEEIRVQYRVPASNVIYDADGLRKFTAQSAKSGLLQYAVPFINNSNARGKDKFRYKNLKAQCGLKLAEFVKQGLVYCEDQTYRDSMIADFEVINKLPEDDEGKIALEKKSDLKERIGRSPDKWDATMMYMLNFIEDEFDEEEEWE